MTICPECFEPLDDFSPCACVLGQTRQMRPAPRAADSTGSAKVGNSMRLMVERKLRNRAAQSARATITVTTTPKGIP